MPASRPRTILRVAKSRGMPNKLLRKAPVTHSSMALPTWFDIPIASSPLVVFWYFVGLRKASMRPTDLSLPVASPVTGSNSERATVSVNMECPKR